MRRLRSIWAVLAFATILASGPFSARAAEGEGKANQCPYAQDQKVDLDGHTLVIPQSVFAGKSEDVTIDGYEIVPNIFQLKLVIIGPYSDMWEVKLSVLSAGKRCTAYYAGDAVLVSSSQSNRQAAKP